jgi:hypothetical protein
MSLHQLLSLISHNEFVSQHFQESALAISFTQIVSSLTAATACAVFAAVASAQTVNVLMIAIDDQNDWIVIRRQAHPTLIAWLLGAWYFRMHTVNRRSVILPEAAF